ncbi:LysR family transcriptional regulator [Alginatibacterium sediminis]|uniref:HTH-type transcriptional regulator MetR n=1 Tax=Alginatibacterium sediminis TaxID=2164068 RepID=A0A420EBP8_9ALTE|nr:LysR family transcriptional regulator [Alginatibacterium sediminis]RKF18120.1 LysR family transcriptional regulator [Alginatibacterium sediminis]
MLELKHLRTLVMLRETQSLVEAGNRLYMTQSALSHQLKDLETRIGASLFVRKSKPLRFTMAGLKALDLADAILPMVHATEHELHRLVEGEAGRLHLAIECHSCFNWLMPAIDQYRGLWPDVELDFASAFSFDPLPELLDGELDLVITSNPQPSPGVRYEALFRYQPKLALGLDHPLINKAVIEPQDFANETLVSYPVDATRLDLFQLFLKDTPYTPKSIRHVEMTLMMMQLVASGKGVAVLPNWALIDYEKKGYIRTRRLGKEDIWQTLWAAYPSEHANQSYFQSFIDIAKRHCFESLKGIRAAQLSP